MGREQPAVTREPGDRPDTGTTTYAVGGTARRDDMKTMNAVNTQSMLAPVLAMAVLGLTVLFFAGYAQSSTLHDAAHDMRHATGFPCH